MVYQQFIFWITWNTIDLCHQSCDKIQDFRKMIMITHREVKTSTKVFKGLANLNSRSQVMVQYQLK